MKKKVQDGRSTKFWLDNWIGDQALCNQFPRLFRLEENKESLVRDHWNDGWTWSWSRPIGRGITSTHLSNLLNLIDNVQLNEDKDEWVWTLDKSNKFVVKSTRQHIDSLLLPDSQPHTRWCRHIPKKVNIFLWRALRDRLPTRWNLSNKGIDIESILCPVCTSSPETVEHTLWTCSLATSIWLKTFQWLDLDFPSSLTIAEVLEDLDNRRFSKENKEIVAAIIGVIHQRAKVGSNP
ncbi:RNA-directed DNA polymerase, eukaryota [Artemisia annua]|uniref:RNA-directed DNA polymerase, eukaryota n=1 Tax=Artemisia annua TaxID=35608 RepID=A0A2U1MKT8_ARTAN|nr:RNA-directed DNA polymerase, eukaryota [Artemisia annua]